MAGHRRCFSRLHADDCRAIDLGSPAGIGNIGVDFDRVALQVHDKSLDNFTLVRGNDERNILLVDFFAGIQNVIE